MIEHKSQLLSAEQAAKLIGLKPSTLRQMACTRKIRSYKVLGALRFLRSDLEELVTERPMIVRERK